MHNNSCTLNDRGDGEKTPLSSFWLKVSRGKVPPPEFFDLQAFLIILLAHRISANPPDGEIQPLFAVKASSRTRSK